MFNNPTPPPGSRVLILGRYSSNLQNPMSADDQIRVCTDRCKQLGWEIVGVYKDEAKSGRSIAKRTGYLDMMAAAEAGLADVICVFALDRLGRNARELHHARDRLSDIEVAIFTLDRGVMSRLEFAIYAEMAQMESERIADRTTRGQRFAASRGRIMGDISYGYRKVAVVPGEDPANEQRLEIDPVTSKVVLRVHQDYDAGISPFQIARDLTAEGVPTPEGNKNWHSNTILGSKRSGCGLLRNPIYVGRAVFGKVKTTYDAKTGKITKHKTSVADRIEHEAPWLRIIPDDLWERNQSQLEERSFELPSRGRRPDYLLSGRVRCGVCGHPYALVATKMGCTARRVGACNNRRRVARQDLERIVLDGLTLRLAQSSVIEWFVPEYVREYEAATQDGVDRAERNAVRLADVTREIDNLVKQMKVGASGRAAQILNENLESLCDEKERLSRDLRVASPTHDLDISPGDVTRRLGDLLDELGVALQGNERDATRAKEIIRSFIEKVTITPIEPTGRPDGRGTGAVRVTVDGKITTLLDHALLDRKILHRHSAGDVQGLPIASFRLYVDLTRDLSDEQEGIWGDVAVLGRLLDDAEYPVLTESVLEAMNDRNRSPTLAEMETDERRTRLALAQLKRDRWIRSIRLGATFGWVWNDVELTDDEWRDRYDRRDEFKPPIGIVRTSPPAAHVIVVGS